MKNYLWVVEYNGFPRKLRNSWTPILTNPDWNRDGAVNAARERVEETGKPKSNYRVKKYVSE